MALDFDKLKEKLNQLQNPGAARSKRPLWKPRQDGETSTIRLLEYPHDDDPFVELHFHYGVGNRSFLCPKYTAGKPCPVCDWVSTLYNSGSEEDKKVAKELRAKPRIYAAVIDRADEKPVPKLWGFGKTVYQELIGYLLNEDYGNYMDPDQGLDVTVQYIKGGGQTYPSTTLTFRRKESKLADSAEEAQRIKDAIPKVDEVFQAFTKSEIQEALSEWLELSKDPEGGSTGELIKGGGKAEAEVEEVTSELVEDVSGDTPEDIDAAFEDALAG